MTNPVIAKRQPIEVNLDAEKTYYWCSCGKSTNQPFCDGSHKNSSFQPLAFTPDKAGSAALCQCKHSKNAPYCDGAHMKLVNQ